MYKLTKVQQWRSICMYVCITTTIFMVYDDGFITIKKQAKHNITWSENHLGFHMLHVYITKILINYYIYRYMVKYSSWISQCM